MLIVVILQDQQLIFIHFFLVDHKDLILLKVSLNKRKCFLKGKLLLHDHLANFLVEFLRIAVESFYFLLFQVGNSF